MKGRIHKWFALSILLISFAVDAYPAVIQNYADKLYAYESLTPADSLAQPKRIYTTTFVSKPPVIDGALNDSCWNLGEWQSDYRQFAPVYNSKASHKTMLKILYDKKNIYVGVRSYDEMDKITRRLGRRDEFSGDIVGVHFDSYFDRRTAFEFDITSAGQKLDIRMLDSSTDTNWNAIWYGKVAYEDSAWTAEMKIPFSQLRYGPSSEQTWGLDAWRFVDRLNEENQWNLVANDGTGCVYTFGELHGLKGLKKNRRFEIAPYLSTKVTSGSTNHSSFNDSSWKGYAGFDAKIGITNNFTLDATINPDFGQVEADPSVMNLSAYETFFEDKRPFFIEGKDIFDFTFDSNPLFYSRRIGHAPSYMPNYEKVSMPVNTTIGSAFKLSGKTSNGLSIGLIESLTLKEMADIRSGGDEFKQAVEPLTNYFVGRVQKEADRGNMIVGGIFTHAYRSIHSDHLRFLPNNAFTYGINFIKYWQDRKYFLELKTVGSRISGDGEAINLLQTSSARYFQRPDSKTNNLDSTRTNLNGYGFSFNAGRWSKGHWRYNEEFVMSSPGLELNDMGYMTLSNMMKNNSVLSYVEKKNTSVYKNYMLTTLQQNAWNADGEGLYSLLSLTGEMEFMNSWMTRLNAEYKFRTVDEWLLRGGPSMKVPNTFRVGASLQTNTSKRLYLILSGNYKKGQSHSIDSLNISATVNFRLYSNLLLSLKSDYIRNLDRLQYVGQFANGSSKSYLLGKVDNRNLGMTFRADLALSPELTIQYYGSPFVSIGRYSDFKEVTSPHASQYYDRFNVVVPEKNNQKYVFDFNHDGVTDYSVTNPDFNYQQFRSNLVLRWEYKVGSTLYLVWSQDRTQLEECGPFNFSKGWKHLFKVKPENIFMVKFNYWFSI